MNNYSNHISLIDALRKAAETRNGIYFVDGIDKEEYLSYNDLYDQAVRLSTKLQKAGVKRNCELVFQFDSLKNLIVNYWACLACGIIPVPLEYDFQDNSIKKVFQVWKILKSPYLITDSDRLLEKYTAYSEKTGQQETLNEISSQLFNYASIAQTVDDFELAEFVDSSSLDDIAFIQFSSGSTGMPKGVTLTHKNLLSNIGDILASVEQTNDDVFCSWKPITHDFGMIGFHIAPVVSGLNQIRISTGAFIWNPSVWFHAVNKYRGSILGSPNFGYRHFLKLFHKKKKREFVSWDLSCVKVIINGAEPISVALCNDFKRELRQYGLPETALTPAYGLAEGSLVSSLCPLSESNINAICVDRRSVHIGESPNYVHAENPHAVNFVDCGIPYPNTEICITDSQRKPVPDGCVGHIEIKGRSVTMGYYRNEQVTREAISDSGWLNTQDLGMIIKGRLFVVGRVKEMIIIGGVNYFPYDIESAILREFGHDQLNKYIAAGVYNEEVGSEELLIFIYFKPSEGSFPELADKIQGIINNNFSIVPVNIIPVTKIPKTTSGKIQRHLLIENYLYGDYDCSLLDSGQVRKVQRVSKQTLVSTTEIKRDKTHTICDETARIVAQMLNKKAVDRNASFFDLGFTSLRLLTLRDELEQLFDIDLSSTSALDYPSVTALACEIDRVINNIKDESTATRVNLEAHEKTSSYSRIEDNSDIAVVSVACRFPGSDTPQEFWELLANGYDPVQDVPENRWTNFTENKITSTQGGYIADIDKFDPLFFGISPAEATATDPQQRILLEVCHQAIENAGWQVKALEGSKTAVYIGISNSEYNGVAQNLGHETGPYTFTGNMFNCAAGRISYTFGFEGPCAAVDTACSSSLVAIVNGVKDLRDGSCDTVIAGGVNLLLQQDGHVSFSQLNALSETGRCRTFDDNADGYIRSEGCGIVILKRLNDAVAQGDNILAVIKGVAVNHNGRSGGLTIPSGAAQQRLIRDALKDANISAQSIDYIEAHGSGTKIGDPQELNALAKVFEQRHDSLKVGSVKSNIGHLESAAGIAGFIKLILMMNHQEFSPNLHFSAGNSLVDWDKNNLQVVTGRQPWICSDSHPRSAGISSFGISGTNAHLVLTESTNQKNNFSFNCGPVRKEHSKDSHLFTLSAKSTEGLDQFKQALASSDYLNQHSIATSCRSSNILRSGSAHRFAITVKSVDELRYRLTHGNEGSSRENLDSPDIKIGFIFTGQGSIYKNACHDLYQTNSRFKSSFDKCNKAFSPLIGGSVIEFLFANKDQSFSDPEYSQAAIFSIEYALNDLWQYWGISPDVVIGHSIGEYAAAHAAGVLEFQQCVDMVAARGRVIKQKACTGAMLGILASEAQVKQLIADFDDVFISAINTQENVTVAGSVDSIAALAKQARKKRLFTEKLPMQFAFHTPLMKESADELFELFKHQGVKAPVINYISGQTGLELSKAEDLDASYWKSHLCQPVQYSQALKKAVSIGINLFIEIGGNATLSGLGAQIVDSTAAIFLPSQRESVGQWKQLSEAVGELYTHGKSIDWQAYHEDATDIDLNFPNTPFARQRIWHADLRGVAKKTARTDNVAACSLGSNVNANNNSHEDLAKQPALNYQKEEEVNEQIKQIISQVTGVNSASIDNSASIFDLGVDSLMLTQIARRIEKNYQIKIAVKAFFENLNVPDKICAYVIERLPSDYYKEATQNVDVVTESSASQRPEKTVIQSSFSADSSIHNIVTQQLEIMKAQIAMLSGRDTIVAGTRHVDGLIQSLTNTNSAHSSTPRKNNTYTKNYPKTVEMSLDDLNVQQAAFVASIAEQSVAQAPRSREFTEKHRPVLADWLSSSNFNRTIKEMSFPIVAERSKGANFWDIDGNEYIDTSMSYGATLFGHSPEFITRAINVQLEKGTELGPQSMLAGEVAALVCEMTGSERVAFCNSGTEAVMAALRIARAVTRKTKVVRFINSYHGSFDGVLAEAGDEGSVPVAIGIADSMIADTIVLPYCDFEELDKIRAVGDDLAAILVEPIQSRNPENYSVEYLRELRCIADDLGCALIFDEMITGFRSGPGGVQAVFGVKADLVTYGKVVGGGMPIGIVAGLARYLDSIDGGKWHYGDESYPSVPTTFFAGTFCKHPLAMAASFAALKHLKENGSQLLAAVNDLTAWFVDQTNKFFEAESVPIKTLHFHSLYRFETYQTSDPRLASLEMQLFFRVLILKGIYFWERRTAFFSTAHTKEHAEAMLAGVKEAVTELRDGGFNFRRRILTSMNVSTKQQNALELPDQFELSSEERRMYVLSLMEGGEKAYHVTGLLNVEGNFSLEKGQAAVDFLVNRHPMLSASYQHDEKGLFHTMRYQKDFRARHYVLKNESLDDAVLSLTETFKLTQAPLWCVTFIEQTVNHWSILFDFHHLIADGISISILIEEFFQHYFGQTITALSPENQYPAFVTWENKFLASKDFTQQVTYWKNQLTPLPAPLELPNDHARPDANDFRGKNVHCVIPKTLCDRVVKLSLGERVTPFITLLTAYFILMKELSGQDDLCIGTPFDRRQNGDFEKTVGMFAQTLVIRSKTNGAMTVSDYLSSVKNTCFDAYDNANCSLESIINALNIKRDLSRNPLFDTMFIFEKGDRRVIKGDDLVGTMTPIKQTASAFDLTFEITEIDGVYHCSLIYATRLFDQSTLERWSKYYINILEQITRQPSLNLQDISLLDQEEKDKLLNTFNDTALNINPDETLVSLIDQSTETYSDAVAVEFNNTRLTYAQLNDAAERVAATLDAQNIKSHSKVAIMLPRGVELIAAMLGVLKHGSSYIPIAPDYPAARVQYMLDKSACAALITVKEQQESITYDGKWLFSFDSTVGTSTFKREISAQDLAYIIFTSGSTGQPKGVMIEHRTLVNFLHGMNDVLALPLRTNMLGLTTVSFDIFVLEVFLTLMRGGTLVLTDEMTQRDPSRQISLIKEKHVNVLQATPSRLQLMLAVMTPQEAFSTIDVLLVGGEALPKALLNKLQQAKNIKIVNVYGPTETTVWSSAIDLSQASEVVLGGPIANTKFYVLEKNRNLCPIGKPGDLYIAGNCLARGYLNDSEKTDKAFVENPFAQGTKMYATGDRAAWTEEGTLRFVGREDKQVKLRGHRVELQEIEQVLNNHPSIAQTAVIVSEAGEGNSVLVAYIVKSGHVDESINFDNHPELTETLRNYVRRYLPEYMVPAFFVQLKSLPLTPNGKIDRLSLPNVVQDILPGHNNESQPHLDDIDHVIFSLWKQILNTSHIGFHDSFFDLGGNSFSLVTMHGKLNQHYPGALEVADIFANPTIVSLKEKILRHLNGQVLFPETPLPEAYFETQKSDKVYERFTARLSGTVNANLIAFAARQSTDVEKLICAYLCFYLNRISKSDDINISTYNTEEKIQKLTIDFNAITSFSALIKTVDQLFNQSAATDIESDGSAYSPSDRPNVRLLYGTALKPANRYKPFDITFSTDTSEDETLFDMSVRCNYLSEKKMEVFLQEFLKIVRVLVLKQFERETDSTEESLA